MDHPLFSVTWKNVDQHLRDTLQQLENAVENVKVTPTANENETLLNPTNTDFHRLVIALSEIRQQLMNSFLKVEPKLSTEAAKTFIQEMKTRLQNVIEDLLSDEDMQIACKDPNVPTMFFNRQKNTACSKPGNNSNQPGFQIEILVEGMKLQKMLSDMVNENESLYVNKNKKVLFDPKPNSVYNEPRVVVPMTTKWAAEYSEAQKGTARVGDEMQPLCLTTHSSSSNDHDQVEPLCLVTPKESVPIDSNRKHRKQTLGGQTTEAEPSSSESPISLATNSDTTATAQQKISGRKRKLPTPNKRETSELKRQLIDQNQTIHGSNQQSCCNCNAPALHSDDATGNESLENVVFNQQPQQQVFYEPNWILLAYYFDQMAIVHYTAILHELLLLSLQDQHRNNNNNNNSG